MWKLLVLLLVLALPLESYAKPNGPCGPRDLNLANAQLENLMATLTPPQSYELKAQIAERKARLKILQQNLTQKLAELRSLRYDQKSSPESLPKLGLELQELRSKIEYEYQELAKELKLVDDSLNFTSKHCFKNQK